MKIDTLINSRFNEFDPDMLSVLTRTLMDLDDKIQLYKSGLKHGEMFNVNYTRNTKERKLKLYSRLRNMNVNQERKEPSRINPAEKQRPCRQEKWN